MTVFGRPGGLAIKTALQGVTVANPEKPAIENIAEICQVANPLRVHLATKNPGARACATGVADQEKRALPTLDNRPILTAGASAEAVQ